MAHSFSGFGSELLQRIRGDVNAKMEDDVFEEKLIGIRKATTALLEAEVGDEKIIFLLQKHWDLRQSEATELLQQEKHT